MLWASFPEKHACARSPDSSLMPSAGREPQQLEGSVVTAVAGAGPTRGSCLMGGSDVMVRAPCGEPGRMEKGLGERPCLSLEREAAVLQVGARRRPALLWATPEADPGPAGLGHRRAGWNSEPERSFQQSVLANGACQAP